MTVTQPAPAQQRLSFLDALRGIAALAVVLQHCAELLWPRYLEWSQTSFRPGAWGVFVFFMLSGFVIPLSTKRETSAISFWIGRLFRLFPLYWFALVVAAVLYQLDLYPRWPEFQGSFGRNLFVNFSMVQEFLGTPHLIGAAWSLAYEFVFYLFISIAIIGGFTNSSVKTTSLTLAASASVGLLIHPEFVTNPQNIIKSAIVPSATVVAIALVFLPRIEGWKHQALAFGLIFATVGFTLNQPRDLWFSLLLFATIGCGWVYHGAYTKQHSLWIASLLSLAVVVLTVVQFVWWANPASRNADMLTILAAHVTFAAFYQLRNVVFPKALTWLGLISYSVYLNHAIVIHAVPEIEGQPILTLLVWVVVTVVVSYGTYRFVEKPAHQLGSRLRSAYRDKYVISLTEPGTTKTKVPLRATVASGTV